MLEGLVILPSSIIFIIQGFGHQLSLANWSLFFKEGEDPYKPETWRYMPLWRRMIIQSIVYSSFLFLAFRCGENPVSHPALVIWTGVSYLLCLIAHWGIYPANKLLIDNALTFRVQSGASIKINRYLFILPVLLAFVVLSLLGNQMPDRCYR